jgi:putative ABC transport system permease protein
VPFGPAYAFADVDLARELSNTPSDRIHFVLVRVAEGHSVTEVRDHLQARIPDALVLTRDDYHTNIVAQLLREQLGMSFGISTSFGLIIGLVIVALSMFSSVLDNLREFGTLKAIGCTNLNLTALLLVQSATYALVGSVIGLGWVTQIVEGIRQPLLVPIIPHAVIYGVPIVMVVLCLFASSLALLRIRRLEPAMVFR